jgi:hypothetical protein
MPRLRKTVDEDLEFTEELGSANAIVVSLLEEAAQQANWGVAYMDRMISAAPDRHELMGRIENLESQIKAAKLDDEPTSITLLAEAEAIHREAILCRQAWVKLAAAVSPRSGELAISGAKVELEVAETIASTVDVIGCRITVVRQRSLAPATMASEMARCNRLLTRSEEKLRYMAKAFPRTRPIVHAALGKAERLREEHSMAV